MFYSLLKVKRATNQSHWLLKSRYNIQIQVQIEKTNALNFYIHVEQ